MALSYQDIVPRSFNSNGRQEFPLAWTFNAKPVFHAKQRAVIGAKKVFPVTVQKPAGSEIQRQTNMWTGILVGKYLIAPALQKDLEPAVSVSKRKASCVVRPDLGNTAKPCPRFRRAGNMFQTERLRCRHRAPRVQPLRPPIRQMIFHDFASTGLTESRDWRTRGKS